MINNITNKHNNNRFIPIDHEERSALELIGEVVKKTNQVINDTNKNTNDMNGKVSKKELKEIHKLNGSNFTGSWFGIPRPEFAEPGIQGQVTQNREQLELLQKRFLKLKNLYNENVVMAEGWFDILELDEFNSNISILIKAESETINQEIELNLNFNSLEKSAFMLPSDYIVSKISGGRIFTHLRYGIDNITKKIVVQLKSINVALKRIDITVGGEYPIDPILRLNMNNINKPNFNNPYGMNEVELSNGYIKFGETHYYNTQRYIDNIVINDDIIMYPETETKFSALRLNDSSVILKHTGNYSSALGIYFFTHLAKLRMVNSGTAFILQVGKGSQEDESNNKGEFTITGWNNEYLQDLYFNAENTIVNGDLRLDGRNKSNPSSIFFFGNDGYSQIQQNLTTDNLEISNNDGGISLTCVRNKATLNQRTLLSAESCTNTDRPQGVMQGYMIFDRQLGKPIWWNGTKWVDSQGNTI